MGFPTPDMFLRSISGAQWAEWRAWRKIRGPIGPERFDSLAAYIGMRMAGTVRRDVEFKDFLDEVRWLVEAADHTDEFNGDEDDDSVT